MLIHLFEHRIEVADRLVIVDGENNVDGFHCGRYNLMLRNLLLFD
jgi:hypothetical protein